MKKEKNNILLIEKILKISLIILTLISFSIISYISVKNYLIEKDLKITIQELEKNLAQLNKDKEKLTVFNVSDITNLQKKFENKKYQKEILDIETGKIEFIEKVFKKDTNKFYATIKVPVIAKTELDFKKYILFQSLNKNIYKLTEISKDKNITKIELIYEL
jgi:hypothetical protein